MPFLKFAIFLCCWCGKNLKVNFYQASINFSINSKDLLFQPRHSVTGHCPGLEGVQSRLNTPEEKEEDRTAKKRKNDGRQLESKKKTIERHPRAIAKLRDQIKRIK
jgi:hypothetical protein